MHPKEAGDAFGDFFGFGLEDILEFLIMFGDKRLGTDDAGIGKIKGVRT
jgi:hypothetical protein